MKCKEEIKKHLDAISELLEEQQLGELKKEVTITASRSHINKMRVCELCASDDVTKTTLIDFDRDSRFIGAAFTCAICMRKMFT